jgi:hypothetical protein
MSSLENNSNLNNTETRAGLSTDHEEILAKVLEAVRQVKFGNVQVTIQDGRVVQIDRTEKLRFTHH